MRIKFLIGALIALCSIATLAQPGSIEVGAIRSKVAAADTAKAIASATTGKGVIFYNSNKNKFRMYYNGTGYDIAVSSGGTVLTVSGTTNRITSTGGTTPAIDISATFEALLGKVANPLSQFASTTSAQLRGVLSDELGTGAALFDGSTPTSLILTNATGLPVSGLSNTGAGVGTYLVTPTWTNLLSATTGTTPFWSLGSGGAFTSPLTFNGTATNTLKFSFPNLTNTLVNGAGLYLQNPTSATVGTPIQYSPNQLFEAQGLETTGNTSIPVQMRMTLKPVSGTAYPTGVLDFTGIMNNGAVTGTPLALSTDGILTTKSNVLATIVDIQNLSGQHIFRVNANSGARWYLGNSANAYMESTTNGTATPSISGNSLGMRFDQGLHLTNISSINTDSAPNTFNNWTASAAGTSGSTVQTIWNWGLTLNYPTGTQSMNVNMFDPVLTNTAGLTKLNWYWAKAGDLVLGSSAGAVSAKVDVQSTTKGFLPPRMTTTQKNAIASPAEGLMVYDTTLHKLCVYTGSAWETITSI